MNFVKKFTKKQIYKILSNSATIITAVMFSYFFFILVVQKVDKIFIHKIAKNNSVIIGGIERQSLFKKRFYVVKDVKFEVQNCVFFIKEVEVCVSGGVFSKKSVTISEIKNATMSFNKKDLFILSGPPFSARPKKKSAQIRAQTTLQKTKLQILFHISQYSVRCRIATPHDDS
jgi:hypothetical protein